VSCSVEIESLPAKGGDSTAARSTPKLTAKRQRVFDILRTALIEAGKTVADPLVPKGVPAITRQDAYRYGKRHGWGDDSKGEKSARSSWNATLNDLVGIHTIGLSAEHIWIPKRGVPQ
jgi:hypothetical protein